MAFFYQLLPTLQSLYGIQLFPNYRCTHNAVTSPLPGFDPVLTSAVSAGGEGDDPHGELCPGRAERQGAEPGLWENGGAYRSQENCHFINRGVHSHGGTSIA